VPELNLGKVKINTALVSSHHSDWFGDNPEFSSKFILIASCSLAFWLIAVSHFVCHNY